MLVLYYYDSVCLERLLTRQMMIGWPFAVQKWTQKPESTKVLAKSLIAIAYRETVVMKSKPK